MKNLLVILAAVIVVALPFVFRHPADTGDWREGDPVLVVITPHNEAIRQEFGEAFSRWHRARHGRPVKLDWRIIGGTTEIMRYLASEYSGSAQAWWKRTGRAWPAGGGDLILDRRFNPQKPPAVAATNAEARAAFETQRTLWTAFRASDDPDQATSGIDLFFGGGTYDHEKAGKQGLTVSPWRPGDPVDDPAGLRNLLAAIPTENSGEVWRTDLFFGAVLSTFGICYNPDRLADLGIPAPPATWRDLAAPRYFGQIGMTDPTKSGSVAKAFEMIVQEQCRLEVEISGYDNRRISEYEAAIAAARLPPGIMPTNVPAAYQAAIERGWLKGVNLLRRIGANARYFTDSAGKVPIDVGAGAVAAGIAIDFYGRFQAESSRAPDGRERVVYITPFGGSSVSADPISLLRGAPHRALAVRFMAFTLGPEGQKLWNYRPKTPGGPQRFALRRLPIQRAFYPSADPDVQAQCLQHHAFTSDDLTDPGVDPYRLAGQFVYQPRWTGAHFGIQRDLVRAMCLDSGDELRAAWRAILDHGGPEAQPQAMELLAQLPDLPVPLTWRSAVEAYAGADRLEYLRRWTAFFRTSYRAAAAAARGNP
jgi:ABC-type Fe3+ transport system substrate-binding protein